MLIKWIALSCLYFFSFALWAEDNQSPLSFPSEFGIDAVFLHHPLHKGIEKTKGNNKGAVFKLEDGTIIHIKEREQLKDLIDTSKLYDPLSISYTTSKILQSIIPKQIVQVLVVHTSDNILIGSFDIPRFKKRRQALSPFEIFACHYLRAEFQMDMSVCELLGSNFEPGKEKNSKLLDLALDLTDIYDRHVLNVGSAYIDHENLAVAVDIDRSDLGASDWLVNKNYKYFLDTDVQEALHILSLISDESFDEICDKALEDFNKALSYRFEKIKTQKILNDEEKEDLFKNLDLLIKTAKKRKRQMRWAYEHLEKIKAENEKWFFCFSYSQFLIKHHAPVDKHEVFHKLQNSNSFH